MCVCVYASVYMFLYMYIYMCIYIHIMHVLCIVSVYVCLYMYECVRVWPCAVVSRDAKSENVRARVVWRRGDGCKGDGRVG